MQPLPVLTEAQVKVVGPLQPSGKALDPLMIARFLAGIPSSVVNVILTVVLDPTITLNLAVEVATTLLFETSRLSGASDAIGSDTVGAHAANIPRLASTTVQRLSNFSVLLIISPAAFIKMSSCSTLPIRTDSNERTPARDR
jgi:hypothetical protein